MPVGLYMDVHKDQLIALASDLHEWANVVERLPYK
jgi:hypothetical protein